MRQPKFGTPFTGRKRKANTLHTASKRFKAPFASPGTTNRKRKGTPLQYSSKRVRYYSEPIYPRPTTQVQNGKTYGRQEKPLSYDTRLGAPFYSRFFTSKPGDRRRGFGRYVPKFKTGLTRVFQSRTSLPVRIRGFKGFSKKKLTR